MSDDQKQRLIDLGLEKDPPPATESGKKRKIEDGGDDEKNGPPGKKKAAASSNAPKQKASNSKKDSTVADHDSEGDKSSFRIQQWEKKYSKVKQFHSEHGHGTCKIPETQAGDVL